MALLATESATTLAALALTGRSTDNVNGGTESLLWHIVSGGEPCYGNNAGQIGISSNACSIVRDSRIRKIRVRFDPNGGTSAFMVSGFVRNDTGNHLQPRRIGILWASGQTLLRLFETATVGGGYTNRASKTVTAPGAPVELELDATTGTTVYARVFESDGTTLLHEISYNFPALPPGDGWGVGGGQGGNSGFFDNVSFFDGPVATPPVLGTPVATSTGSSSAGFTVSTDKANGTIYALFSGSTPDADTIIGTGTPFAVTASGTQTGALSGLPNATTGKVHIVHVLPTLERSNVARSNTITLNDPLPAPDTTVLTTIGTSGGLRAVIVSGVATNTSSVSVSLPAAGTPNGAVTRPALNVVPDGSGNWSVPFVEPPYGTYAVASLILANPDHPVVNKSGDQGIDLIPIEGSDVPDGSEVPDVPVTFAGPVPAQTAQVGVPFSIDLSQYFSGTRAPFTYALQAGSLAGSGLALSGSTISGTPSTATALTGIVVRATDAGPSTADTNTFSITITAASVAPAITTQPASLTRIEGQTAAFTVAASGTSPLSYQWRRGGVNITGANSASYTTGVLALSDSGAAFTCVVTNSAGSATSNDATLTVQAATVSPALTLPTGVAASSTTANGSVTTNKAGGTLYTLDAVGSPNATAIKAGVSRPVTSSGLQMVSTSGLTAGTPGYQRHYVWVDADGAESAIARSSAFDTPSAPTLPPGPGGRLAVAQKAYFAMLAHDTH